MSTSRRRPAARTIAAIASLLAFAVAAGVVSATEEDAVRAESPADESGVSSAGAADGAGARADHVREVAPGHFVHLGRHEDMTGGNGGDVANGGFVIGERAVAVIDPGGGTATARALMRALRARSDLPITHVVLTHVHPDHTLGAAVFADADVDVVAHANYARALAQRGAFYRDRFGALIEPGTAWLEPTRELAAGERARIDLGGRTLELRAYPTAHTDNDLSAFDRSSGTLWAGDLVFAERLPALDGSLRGWLEALDAIVALESRLIVPGHGEPGKPAPMLGAQRAYLERLLVDTRARIAAGERLADALAAAEREGVAASWPGPGGGVERWSLFELHHPTNVTRAWTELEWE